MIRKRSQFDLLMLRLQLGLLRHEKSFARWGEDVREIAGSLEEKAGIPMVRAELELIIEVQTDEFWQDITTAMLENVRSICSKGLLHFYYTGGVPQECRRARDEHIPPCP